MEEEDERGVEEEDERGVWMRGVCVEEGDERGVWMRGVCVEGGGDVCNKRGPEISLSLPGSIIRKHGGTASRPMGTNMLLKGCQGHTHRGGGAIVLRERGRTICAL